jgi:adenosylcobinamide kinase/adenosylcobinamide-phosphate guanylyltransferase
MRLVLLGTGSADGLPNPWCDCPTCLDQLPRGRRSPTSALVDGRLLLDSGPEAPGQAVRLGHSLAEVRVVAIGHAHHDHCDPAFTLYRSWVASGPLTVVGPPPVMAQLRPWLDDAGLDIDLRPVSAGEVVEVAGYRLTALAANHHAFGEAVLYLVDDGTRRLLYATDTGVLPPATLDALAGSRLDGLLLEETFGTATDLSDGHLHLATFAETVAGLREIGAVTDDTQVVAVHLSHHNPPLADLRAELARCGARVHPDGTVLEL